MFKILWLLALVLVGCKEQIEPRYEPSRVVVYNTRGGEPIYLVEGYCETRLTEFEGSKALSVICFTSQGLRRHFFTEIPGDRREYIVRTMYADKFKGYHFEIRGKVVESFQ